MTEQTLHNQQAPHPSSIHREPSSWKKTLITFILAGLGFFVVLPIVVLTLYVKVLVLILNNNVVGEILLFPLVAVSLILGYVLFEAFFLRERKKV